MANRPKTERNKKILEYWNKGWRQIAIANMFKMKVSAVSMVVYRERLKKECANCFNSIDGLCSCREISDMVHTPNKCPDWRNRET